MKNKKKGEVKPAKTTRTVFISRIEVHHPDALEQVGEDIARVRVSPTVHEGEGHYNVNESRGVISVENDGGDTVSIYAPGSWTKVTIARREEEQPIPQDDPPEDE
jgi:hypothetical protein